METIYSVSIMVGSAECNARCGYCGGHGHRQDALSSSEGTLRNLRTALLLCHKSLNGGWSISLTGSGEPTLSPVAVTKTLEGIDALRKEGVSFPTINLFTNGISIVNDPAMRAEWLPKWRELGLTHVAISVHSTDLCANRNAYNLADDYPFPELSEILDVVRRCGLTPRVTLLLRRHGVSNWRQLRHELEVLRSLGVNLVTSWALVKPDGKRSAYTPRRVDLLGIRLGLLLHAERVLGHPWGGGVWAYRGISFRLTTYVTRFRPRDRFIRQLVLFQDGRVSYSWFQDGFYYTT